MTDVQLPPLPEPEIHGSTAPHMDWFIDPPPKSDSFAAFSDKSMQAYGEACARAAVLAEREATLAAVNALIKDGPFKGNGWDDLAQNNGVILAANLLYHRMWAAAIRKGE